MAINLCRVALRGVNGRINTVTPLLSVGLAAKLPNFQLIKPCQKQQQQRTYITTPYKIGKMLKLMTEKSKIIVVEGNIACGKSKVAKDIADILGMLYMPEADEQYVMQKAVGERVDKKFVGDVSLEQFYADPFSEDGHSFAFQLCMYHNRYHQMCDAIQHVLDTAQGVVLERSVYSDYVFMEAMHKMGYFGKDRVKLYEELVFFSLYKLVPPHCVVFLDIPVEKALEGIKSRGNLIEQTIPKAYLEHIENTYKNDYLPKATESIVLEYDWTNPLNNVERIVEDFDLVTEEDWKHIAWNKLSDEMIFTMYDYITSPQAKLNSFMINSSIPEFEYKAGEYMQIKEEFDAKYHPKPKNFKEAMSVLFSFK